jgi:flagellin
MERLATGKQNATAGDRSSYQAMADTFRLDYVATKAGIKGASVVMGYLETAMRTLDAASGVLSRLQELAVLGANETNTASDLEAIDAEAEALGDEFHRLLSTAKYKGKDLFLSAAGGEYVSLGGRDAEMTFGVKKIQYSNLYLHSYLEYAAENGTAGADDDAKIFNAQTAIKTKNVVAGSDYMVLTKSTNTDGTAGELDNATDEAVRVALGLAVADLDTGRADKDAAAGEKWTATANATFSVAEVVKQEGQLLYAASEGLYETTPDTDMLIDEIEAVQGKINTARVQAGSQYAALESAVGYVTDLTAQYELGYNTVNDVNFSMETAHLAKNQILQQAATAMLAQANQGQQSLLQLIQG